MRRRIIILIFTVAGLFILYKITWLYLEVEEDTRRSKELCDPHRGWGLTTLNFKVLDKDSNKPLDSVRLVVRYGASGDRIVDTLLRQDGTLHYTFLIPQIDECEYYWAEVSHPQYAEALYQLSDTLRTVSLKNGTVNEAMLYLKPATRIKVRLYDKIPAGDTLRLFVSQNIKDDMQIWYYFTVLDFQQRRWTGFQTSLESGHTYKVTWVYQHADQSDTALSNFYAVPFDTLRLTYTLK